MPAAENKGLMQILFLLGGLLIGFNIAMILFSKMVRKPDYKWAENMLGALESVYGLSGEEEYLAIKTIKED